jgi:endonuclease VIII
VPEGDTVYLAATRLHKALSGERITRSDFRVPRYATSDLPGHVIEEVTSHGKHMLFRISGGLLLHTHFKMEGAWDLYRTGERFKGPGWQIRVILETATWVAVGFRLPVVDLVESTAEEEFIGHLGPDPLREWDEDEALARLQEKHELTIGEALLDQTIVAGFGNVYKSEICFLRGIHPDTKVGEIENVRAVLSLGRRLMEANRTTGQQITTGDGRRGRTHWVYGRGNQPCRRCGTPIRKMTQPSHGMDRVTYWCPNCQQESEQSKIIS